MEEKFRKAILLMSVPSIINLGIAAYCFVSYDRFQFYGYISGAGLAIVFSILWLWMAKRVTFSNPFKLFTISIGLFPVKLLVFMIVAFGTLYLVSIDKFFFGFAFMIGTIMTLFVEVRFIVDVNRSAAENKKRNNNKI